MQPKVPIEKRAVAGGRRSFCDRVREIRIETLVKILGRSLHRIWRSSAFERPRRRKSCTDGGDGFGRVHAHIDGDLPSPVRLLLPNRKIDAMKGWLSIRALGCEQNR